MHLGEIVTVHPPPPPHLTHTHTIKKVLNLELCTVYSEFVQKFSFSHWTSVSHLQLTWKILKKKQKIGFDLTFSLELKHSYQWSVVRDKSLWSPTYRIRPNYRTYPYKHTVKKFRSLQITTSVLFSLLLYKGICCGYSFELHRQVDAIQMSTHNICLCKESQKKSHSHH